MALVTRRVTNSVDPTIRLFHVISHYGTMLCRLESGEIGHVSKEAGLSPWQPLLLATTDADPTRCVVFVEASGKNSVTLPLERWSAVFFPLHRLTLAPGGVCSLAHPYSGRLLLALPDPDADGFGHCVVSRWREPGGWETFQLEEHTPATPLLRQLANEALALLIAGHDGLSQAASENAHSPEQVEVIARLMPQRAFERLAEQVMRNTETAATSLRLAGDDAYGVGLRNLIGSKGLPLPQRSGWLRRKRLVVPSTDSLNDARFVSMSLDGNDGTYRSFAQKLTATARRQIVPTQSLCIVATARNEGPYILEWLAYHRVIGVQKFFLYSNDNDDLSDDLLQALDRNDVVTWLRNTGAVLNVQAKAYAHALAILPDLLDYEWAAFIDLDEFIALRPGVHRTLCDYIAVQANQPVDVIALNWAVYWSNGNARWADGLSIDRFGRQNSGSSLFKSIVRPRKFTFAYPHHPSGIDPSQPVVVRDSKGGQIHYERGEITGYEQPEPAYGDAWVNHYFSRSAEEFFWKWSRNRGDGVKFRSFAEVDEGFLANFVAHHRVEGMTLPDAATIHLADVRAEMSRLSALPGVAQAQSKVIGYRTKQARNTPSLIAAIDRSNLGPHHRAFLDILDT